MAKNLKQFTEDKGKEWEISFEIALLKCQRLKPLLMVFYKLRFSSLLTVSTVG